MKLSLKIPQSIFEEIMYYVDESTGEVSGFGTLSYKDGLFQVEKVVLCEQKNRATETEMDAADIAKAMYLLKDEPHEMKWWWHSHVNMGVFWSGTDKTAMKELAEHGWFLSTVFNKKREMKTCLTFNQGQFGLFDMDDLETDVVHPSASKEVVEAWKANLKAKAKDEPEVRSYGPSPRYWEDDKLDDPGYKDLPLWQREKRTKKKNKSWKEKDATQDIPPMTFDDVWEAGDTFNLGEGFEGVDIERGNINGIPGVWVGNEWMTEDDFVALYVKANFPDEYALWLEDMAAIESIGKTKAPKLIQDTKPSDFGGDAEMEAMRLNGYSEMQ